jgi:hypothetical protein
MKQLFEFGLLAIIILCPINDKKVWPDNYQIKFGLSEVRNFETGQAYHYLIRIQ